MGEGGRRVEETDGGARDEGLQTIVGIVKVVVIAGDKVLEANVGLGWAIGAVLEAAPTDCQWRIDGDEEEEWAAEKDVEDGLCRDVDGDEAAPPALGDKLEQFFGRGKRVGLRNRA